MNDGSDEKLSLGLNDGNALILTLGAELRLRDGFNERFGEGAEEGKDENLTDGCKLGEGDEGHSPQVFLQASLATTKSLPNSSSAIEQ